MQPPDLLVTRLKIQELYPLPVIFPLISLARGNFPCTPRVGGWKPEAVGYPKRVRNRLPCQPTGSFPNRLVDRSMSAPKTHAALPAPDIPLPCRKGLRGCPGGRASPLSNPLTGPLPLLPSRKGLRAYLGGRASPLSNSLTGRLPSPPLRGRVCGAAREGERPRSPIPPQGACPHSLRGRDCGAAWEGERPRSPIPPRGLCPLSKRERAAKGRKPRAAHPCPAASSRRMARKSRKPEPQRLTDFDSGTTSCRETSSR